MPFPAPDDGYELQTEMEFGDRPQCAITASEKDDHPDARSVPSANVAAAGLVRIEAEIADLRTRITVLEDAMARFSQHEGEIESGADEDLTSETQQDPAGSQRIAPVTETERSQFPEGAEHPHDTPASTVAASEHDLLQVPRPIDIGALALEASLAEEESVRTDLENVQAYSQEAEQWAERSRRLRVGVEKAVEACELIATQAKEEKEKLPATLQEKLASRQQGLELTVKMLMRLKEHPHFPEQSVTEDLNAVVSPARGLQEWQNLLSDECDERTAQKVIESGLRQASNERYQVVARVRNAAAGRRTRVLSFIEKQLLPVLDALEDGQRHSDAMVEEAIAGNPEATTSLRQWFDSYKSMQNAILDELQGIDVAPMSVVLGSPIDYNCHEPFDVESDPTMEDEHIKAVTRSGYIYQSQDNEAARVLRPAQVVVVKN
jgi:molecular chaperone GrpE (heat shock protein)